MKAIDLYVNSILPPDLRDPARVLDKKGVGRLMADVARKHPDQYEAIVRKLSDVGRKSAYFSGETISLADLFPVIDKQSVLDAMDAEIRAIKASDLPDDEKRKQTLATWAKYADQLEKMTNTGALEQGNSLGRAVLSGSRGSPFQLKAMLTTPALYTDYKDDPIPLFVRRGFNEGLRPGEFLASSFGVRKGVIATKNATARAGDLSKQLTQSAASQVVTTDDCETANGLDFEPVDPDLLGRVLSRDYGPDLPAGTVVDRQVASQLRRNKISGVLARSPLTCQAKAGLCSKCLGVLPDGKFAPKGYSAGITAAQAIGEPLAQGSLSVKHQGGGFAGTKKTFSGFDVINQLVQSPTNFPNRAAVSKAAGRVERIEDAPQGGKFIYIDGVEHFALPGMDLTVKPGDEVEAGEQLSDGIVDVGDIMETRGLGEARRYYVDRMRQAFRESGGGNPTARNMEVVARGALDHIRIDDPDGMGDMLPDDVTSYNRVSSTFQPSLDARLVNAAGGVGKFLQAPLLHYSIGTKLTPKMVDRISKAGINQIPVSDSEPQFTPHMQRLRAAAHSGEDWLAKMHSSYLTSNIGQDAARARDTNVEQNVHFAPRLAIGKDFGKNIEQTGKF